MIEGVCNLVSLLILIGIGVGFTRVVYGPSLPDRVVALDIIATLVVALILTYCVRTGEVVYIPAAISIALITFVGTVALALYIRKGGPW